MVVPSRQDTIERNSEVRHIAILGATGSIGSQTLDVCRKHSDRLKVCALAVDHDVEGIVAAAREFGVAHIAIADTQRRHDPALAELPESCEVRFGSSAVADLCGLEDVDYVVNAVVGAAGIGCGYEALKAGKVLAYANKESIVVGGDLLMPLVKPGFLIPVDSEHAAIFQCLLGEQRDDLYRIWLTCSGGPFYGCSRQELAQKTAVDALAHPTWHMGPKITVDSATLMNKGLEVIEAHYLFGVPIDQISVLVHPQSRIHSMVEYVDGTVKAQLGPADMRIPIQYALSFPERWDTPTERVDYSSLPPLTFGSADEDAFGCLSLAKEAGRRGGTLPCAMNAANEVANLAFRKGLCGFLDIEHIVRKVMESEQVEPVESLEQLSLVDSRARVRAKNELSALQELR